MVVTRLACARSVVQSLRALPALYVFIVNRTTTKATCRRTASSSGSFSSAITGR
jgi:hypothetical protein